MRRSVLPCRVVALGLAVGAAFGVAVGVEGSARAEKQLDGAQVHQGFALELNVGSRLFSIAGAGTTLSFGALQGGIFAGYKISRVIVGLGFDLSRVASGSSTGGGSETSQADTAILFTPGIRVAIVRSAENRVELFGQFDLGFGTTIHEDHPNQPNAPDRSVFNLVYRIGPGVRFWAHPQFGISAAAGLEGDFAFNTITQNGLGGQTQHTSTGLTSIFAALQLTGVF